MHTALAQLAAPLVYQEAMGIQGPIMLPPDPIQMQPTYESALAAFEAQPSIRVLFDNGAGGENPGEPFPGYEQSFPSLPVPGTTARSWFFGDGGRLTDAKPATPGTDSFKWNQKARRPTNFTGDSGAGDNGLWTATPPYKWETPPAGSGLSYLTEPLTENTTVVGAGRVDAWMRSSRKKVDLQVTITEVRPDGKEVFVQGGWLRADGRKLDARKSTLLEPVLSLRKRDSRPMPRRKFVKVTFPLYYQGHAYRTGSRIRVLITAPGGDQPIWAFAKAKGKGAKLDVAFSQRMPSALVLPVVPGMQIPTGLPPCPGLRAEPCRDYQAMANG
jgi:predicted acyl esterase